MGHGRRHGRSRQSAQRTRNLSWMRTEQRRSPGSTTTRTPGRVSNSPRDRGGEVPHPTADEQVRVRCLAPMAVAESGQVSVVWYSLDGNYQVRAATPSNTTESSPVTLSSSQLLTEAVEPTIATRGGKDNGRLARDPRRHVPTHRLRDDDRRWHVVRGTELARGRRRRGEPAGGNRRCRQGDRALDQEGSCDQGMVSQQLSDGSWKAAERITESDRDNDELRLDVAPSGAAVASWPGIDPTIYPTSHQPSSTSAMRTAHGAVFSPCPRTAARCSHRSPRSTRAVRSRPWDPRRSRREVAG